jgi:hypothetical protein
MAGGGRNEFAGSTGVAQRAGVVVDDLHGGLFEELRRKDGRAG